MWKTRNIRRRNKGRKTKRHDGGGLFTGPSINKIIEFAVKNDMEVNAYFEKKTGMFSKAIKITFKVKFIDKKIQFIQDEETKLDEIDTNIKPETMYRYGINGSNVEVTLNVKNGTKIIIKIDETSISDINDKMNAAMKAADESKSQKIKEITETTKVAQLQKKEDEKRKKEEDYQKKKEEELKKKEDDQKKKEEELKKEEESKYKLHSGYIRIEFTRKPIGSLPYSQHELNYIYYCIETYLPEDSLTQEQVHKFVEEFKKYNSKSPKKEVKEMNKDDAILRLEVGIKLFYLNESKTKLQEMVKKLNVDSDNLDDYLRPKQSLNKKCPWVTRGGYEDCAFIESLKPYADDELVLLDEDNPDEKLKMSIFDFVENGASTKEMWKKTLEPYPYYEYMAYVFKEFDSDSLVGFVCYNYDYWSTHTLKISNIIWADNEMGENPNLRNKLYDEFKVYLSAGRFRYMSSLTYNILKLFIPDELNEMVNTKIYKKGETKDGFTMWDVIVPPKPTEIEMKLKMEKNPKAIQLLEELQKLQIFFGSIKEKPVIEEKQVEAKNNDESNDESKDDSNDESKDEATTEMKDESKDAEQTKDDSKDEAPEDDSKDDAAKESDEQKGGADNALLDKMITKYPSLKAIKSMIDDLPENIRQKYESIINTTLEKVTESKFPETDLMNEPEFQSIQADLNAQFPEKVVTPVKEDETPPPSVEETPNEVPSGETLSVTPIKPDEPNDTSEGTTQGESPVKEKEKTDATSEGTTSEGESSPVKEEEKTDETVSSSNNVPTIESANDEEKTDETISSSNKAPTTEPANDEEKTDDESQSQSTIPSDTTQSISGVTTTIPSITGTTTTPTTPSTIGVTMPSITSTTTTAPSITNTTTTTPPITNTTTTTTIPSTIGVTTPPITGATTTTTMPSTTGATTPTSETSVSTTGTTQATEEGVALKREDLKESPLLVQPITGESGKYIFVPKDLVEKVIEYLLNNGCEVTTINIK